MPTARDGIVAHYRKLRLEDGLTEPQAREAIDRDSMGTPEEVRTILATSCLLDSWPVGWSEHDWSKLARWMTFDDVTYWVSRVVDTSETILLIATLLASQSHLSPLLKSVGPAFHGIPVSGRFSAGKSRCAEVLTYLASGAWFASATVAGLKAVRIKAPIIVGIDEGDEAERDNPGVKAYLLGCHDWNARQLKFSQPDRNGKRVPVTTDYGGPVFVTFRQRPWPAVASRSFIMEMEPSSRYSVSDDGSGEGFRRLLGPARIWLQTRCKKAMKGKNELWAMRRTHEKDFIARLNRITEKVPVLRQRDFARMILFAAELLGLDMDRVEEQLTQTIADQEVESENAVIIAAIESNPLFHQDEVEVEALRLSVQKFLRERKEFVNVNRNRFADVLKEMKFSNKGPMWKVVERDGRKVTVIFPTLWRSGVGGLGGVTALHMENPQTPQTSQTPVQTERRWKPNDLEARP